MIKLIQTTKTKVGKDLVPGDTFTLANSQVYLTTNHLGPTNVYLCVNLTDDTNTRGHTIYPSPDLKVVCVDPTTKQPLKNEPKSLEFDELPWDAVFVTSKVNPKTIYTYMGPSDGFDIIKRKQVTFSEYTNVWLVDVQSLELQFHEAN